MGAVSCAVRGLEKGLLRPVVVRVRRQPRASEVRVHQRRRLLATRQTKGAETSPPPFSPRVAVRATLSPTYTDADTAPESVPWYSPVPRFATPLVFAMPPAPA